MRIVIIGAGNVATHLAKSLDEKLNVVQIYSRNFNNALLLSNKLKNAVPTDDLNAVISDADLYVISVKDDAISHIVENVKVVSGVWVHTSGSVPMSILNKKFARCGVLYPLQTFSREVEVDVAQIPFFVEGSDKKTEDAIEGTAKELSNNVYKANSEQRRNLHIAAVFGCNFVNFMWTQADEILRESGYDFDVLLPVIYATLDKAVQVSPLKGQTGPARRGDVLTMQTHEKMLQKDKSEIYHILSQCIMKKYNIGYEQD